MGIGIFAVWPLAKKIGKRNITLAMPLAPGITNYKKRIQYQTYDVTKLLEEKNTVTAELADGWYRGSCGAWGLRMVTLTRIP